MYIKIVLSILLLLMSLKAQDGYLNIDAKHFEADEQKGFLNFKGDVKMTKNKDILLCQNLIILTEQSTEKKEKPIPKSYEATGDVSFTLYTKDNILKGSGDKVFYYPNERKYIIIGNGYLEDTKEGKKLTAKTIYIDELTGRTNIDGDGDKPVKFRLKLDKNKK